MFILYIILYIYKKKGDYIKSRKEPLHYVNGMWEDDIKISLSCRYPVIVISF